MNFATLALAGALLQVATPVPLPTQAPQAPLKAPAVLVERIVDTGRQVRRLTFFDNRMTVLSVREGGQRVFFVRHQLTQEEWIGYLAALNAETAQLEGEDSSLGPWSAGPVGTITVHLGGGGPRSLRYSPMDVQRLDRARLVGVLDDLEALLELTSPSEEALRGWVPRKGDRVEMYEGATAVVERVRKDGVIILDFEGSPVIEVVIPDHRELRIRRVLARGR